MRATAFALNILLIHALGDAISPPLIGWIAGKTSMDTAFLVVSATMVLAGVFWLFGMRHLGRDTAAVDGVRGATWRALERAIAAAPRLLYAPRHG